MGIEIISKERVRHVERPTQVATRGHVHVTWSLPITWKFQEEFSLFSLHFL